MICQDLMVLMAIYEYDFDPEDMYFCEYVQARTGLDLDGYVCLGGQEILQLSTEEEYLACKNPITTHNVHGKPFTEGERKTNFKVLKIFKGKIQDCWELYNEHEVM